MADQGCWGCEVGAECVSMLKVSLNNQASLTHLSANQLKNSLVIAKRFMDDMIQRQNHPAHVCGCKLCSWSLQVDFVVSASVSEPVEVSVEDCVH